ncbi:hypothetical protein [Roseovarius sp. D0-M9]|uniref:hypothetical protein n=1 Tax=Roseovarius sp. D0-M9 TaxID=3127117 RepID=UPI00300FC39A
MILTMMLPVRLALNRNASRHPPPPSAIFEGARFADRNFAAAANDRKFADQRFIRQMLHDP